MGHASLERRKALRVAVSLTVEVRLGRNFTLHSTRDLSIGGLFFDRAIPHPVGTIVHLAFRLPQDSAPIRCEGEVMNVPNAQGYGMGIRFSQMLEDDVERLEAFVHEMNSGAHS